MVVTWGVISIAVVIVGSELFKSRPRPESDPEVFTKNAASVSQEVDANRRAVTARLDEIQSEMEKIDGRLSSLEANSSGLKQSQPLEASTRSSPTVSSATVPPAPSANRGSAMSGRRVQEALDRGLKYVVKHEYVPEDHNQVQADLIAAYRVKGLSPETNSALAAMIQQVNEIGVINALKEVQTLPSNEATQRVRKFIRDTPRLTEGQIVRLKKGATQSSERE